ncbi:hypothetical protein M422DRAFT_67283 [Sphaerobolus stellatus SS14]|uniref:ER membrane protein complex subunit 7 beta-sandwich domain-containing protein n=1 Tax=Sphaerobolus stellatus (strain SS14) TaxID=990650 RepID=A0A0C9W2A3_SPHS4|nr:hypothetical protein M422DRAFT_67283 [Sphaerobolus stellatus SS14]
MARLSGLYLLASLCFSSIAVCAVQVSGRIQWNDVCPNYTNIRGAKAILDNGRSSGYVRRDGQFTIPDVSPGTYILSILSHDFLFDQVRVDVSDAEPSASVYAYIPGTPLSPAPLLSTGSPVVLSAKARHNYFVERDAFDPVAMFKNPMMMIMLASAVLIFAAPYLKASLDDDSLKELSERQNKVIAAQNSISSMDIGGLTNMLTGSSEQSQKASKPAPTPSKGKAKSHSRGNLSYAL